MELSLCFPYMPSWRGQGRLYLYFEFRADSQLAVAAGPFVRLVMCWGRASVTRRDVSGERDIVVEVRFDARRFSCGCRLAFELDCTAIATQSRLS